MRDFGINNETKICTNSAARICVFNNDTLEKCELLPVHYGYVKYHSNPMNRTSPLNGQYVFAGTLCLATVPISETNIIGYIEYKHAYLNHEPWLDDTIKLLVFEHPHLRLEEYVRLFRNRYHQIPDNDRVLYRTILKYKLD